MIAAPAIWHLLLRVLLWLPLGFFAWYLLAPQYARSIGYTANLVAQMVRPGVVQKVESSGTALAFVTSVQVRAQDGRLAVLAPDVNTHAYTFGSALFLALMLASRARWRWMAAGLFLLLPFQAWGIVFDALAQIVRTGAHFAAGAGMSTASVNLIAAGYQFGSLVFPTVAPVLVWGFFCRKYIESLRTESVDHASSLPASPTYAETRHGKDHHAPLQS